MSMEFEKQNGSPQHIEKNEPKEKSGNEKSPKKR